MAVDIIMASGWEVVYAWCGDIEYEAVHWPVFGCVW